MINKIKIPHISTTVDSEGFAIISLILKIWPETHINLL